jgi:recombinational DNA repair protein RecR
VIHQTKVIQVLGLQRELQPIQGILLKQQVIQGLDQVIMQERFKEIIQGILRVTTVETL